MVPDHMKHDTVSAVVQATPSAALVGTYILGFSLPEWAAIFGIGFVVLQAFYLLWKWQKEWRGK
jgi:hypothetical protein